MAGRPLRRARLNPIRVEYDEGEFWVDALDRTFGASVLLTRDVADVKRFLSRERASTIVLYPPEEYDSVVRLLLHYDGQPLRGHFEPPREARGWKVLFIDDPQTTPFVEAFKTYAGLQWDGTDGGPLPGPYGGGSAIGLPGGRYPWSFPTLYLPYNPE